MAQPYSSPRNSNSPMSEIANDVADKAADYAGKASQQIDRALDGAKDAAREVVEQTSEAGQRVQAVAGNLKGAVDKSVRDQPMATLAVAAALGFVIGALWKS